jgi:hypothetical protein
VQAHPPALAGLGMERVEKRRIQTLAAQLPTERLDLEGAGGSHGPMLKGAPAASPIMRTGRQGPLRACRQNLHKTGALTLPRYQRPLALKKSGDELTRAVGPQRDPVALRPNPLDEGFDGRSGSPRRRRVVGWT